jgi:hypothetical protein
MRQGSFLSVEIVLHFDRPKKADIGIIVSQDGFLTAVTTALLQMHCWKTF